MTTKDLGIRVGEMRSEAFEGMVQAIKTGDKGAKFDAIFDGAMALWLEGDIEGDQHLKTGALIIVSNLLGACTEEKS